VLPQLQQLINVQEVDRRIQLLEQDTRRLPLEIMQAGRVFLEAEREVEQFKLTIAEMDKRRRALEREADYAREELKKKRFKLHEVKSNKEYAAMQAEIAHAEQQISDKEDEVLQVLMDIDGRTAEYKARSEALAELEQKCRQEQEEKTADLERKRVELSELRVERERLVATIEEGLLTLYHSVFGLRKGLAVVNVVNGTCQGCHMTLPPQVVSEVKQNDRIITCGECDRILYYREE